MTRRLDIYLHETLAARLTFLGPSTYRLEYVESWRDDPAAVPLSLSLPLGSPIHESTKVFDFLDNLLPDSPDVRDRWAVAAGLERSEVFDLLERYGADVAGAAEFYPEGAAPVRGRGLEPIESFGIAERIRAIRGDQTAWLDPDLEVGKFSLGGAQAKFALTRSEDRWWLARAAQPTTHIFKPYLRDVEDGALVEFVTMTAGAVLGHDVALVDVDVFDGESSLIVQRFDRAISEGRLSRVHQEDLCQAMGLPRLRKYESHGGPGYRAMLRFFDDRLDPDSAAASKRHYLRGLLYSWLMLNTDAHLKNLSLHLTSEGVTLAPHYDLNSLIPYHHPDDRERSALLSDFAATKLSTRLVDSFAVGDMGAFEWRGAARDADLDADELIAWGRDLCDFVPTVVEAVVADLSAELQTPVLERLVERVGWRCAQACQALTARG